MTTSPELQTNLEARLSERVLAAERTRDAITVRWNQISNLRLILAVLAIGFGFWWLRTGEAVWGLLAAAFALAFIAVLVWHRQLGARQADAAIRVQLRKHAIARIHRDWRSLPEPKVHEVPLDKAAAWLGERVKQGKLIDLKVYAGLYFAASLK